MKKVEIKRLEYSRKKIRQDIFRKQKWFTLSVLLVMLIGLVGFSVTDATVDFSDIAPSGLAMATIMGAVGSINDVENSKKTGSQAKSRLWVISKDQVDDSIPFPPMVTRTRANIPLKLGEYWHYIDTVVDSPEPKWMGEEGDVATTLTQELPFILGGIEDATLDLLEKGAGKEFIIVWEICSTSDRFGGGNGCKGLKLASFEGGSTRDNTSTTITFRGQCGELWYRYSGNTPTQAPSTVAADATSIVLISNSQYQLSDGSAAAVDVTGFSAVTDADINRIVTIFGSGGDFPSTISAGDFLLIGGEEWTANMGSRISFKIFKDGAASYKFVEMAGSRS